MTWLALWPFARLAGWTPVRGAERKMLAFTGNTRRAIVYSGPPQTIGIGGPGGS